MMNSSGTVIGKGICIRGEVTGEEDFFLDGVLEGNITLTGQRPHRRSQRRYPCGHRRRRPGSFWARRGQCEGQRPCRTETLRGFHRRHRSFPLVDRRTTPRCKATSTSPKRPNRRKKSPWPTRKPSQRKPTSMSSSTAKQSKLLEPTGIRFRRPRFRPPRALPMQGAGSRVWGSTRWSVGGVEVGAKNEARFSGRVPLAEPAPARRGAYMGRKRRAQPLPTLLLHS